MNEAGAKHTVDLAIPQAAGWLPVTFGERPGLASDPRFADDAEPEVCIREIQSRTVGWAALTWALRHKP